MSDHNKECQELYRSPTEDKIRYDFVSHFRQCPIPDSDILQNLGLFLNSKNLSRILFMNHIYQQIIDVQGIIVEFGCRWGQNTSLFSALRGIYDPFNRHRKVVAFDTFTGFDAVNESKDNVNCYIIKKHGLTCTSNYADYLDVVMKYQEDDNPMSHVKKYDVRQGDAIEELPKYLEEFPETIIALAYFDFDVYEPTKKCLEMILPHLTQGSVVGFDELNDHDSPGETVALREVLGLNNIKIKRFPYTSRTSYIVMG